MRTSSLSGQQKVPVDFPLNAPTTIIRVRKDARKKLKCKTEQRVYHFTSFIRNNLDHNVDMSKRYPLHWT